MYFKIYLFLGLLDRFGSTPITRYVLKDNGGNNTHTDYRHIPEEIRYDGGMSSSTPSSSDKEDTQIAIFGACGYLGSVLTSNLLSNGYNVFPFDMDPQINTPVCTKLHSNSIFRHQLQSFDVVIFLGGCTGRQSCAELHYAECDNVNIHDVVKLVQNMSPGQHFIVASTAAVMEGRYNAMETDQVFEDKLDQYTSSMYRRELALRHLHLDNSRIPRISMLRLGTVIGISPGQRTDLLVPSLYKSAYKIGTLNVENFNAMRSFLWLDDLSLAVNRIIETTRWDDIELFNVWNLASFSSTILKVATTVSSITGAKIDTGGGIGGDAMAAEKSDRKGFSLNCERFMNFYNFSFRGDLQSVLIEFDQNVPDSISAKGAHLTPNSSLVPNTIPCPVCSSNNQQRVLDLGNQPFANDFRAGKSESVNLTRFPLKLVRCRSCNHLHLSHIASRKKLFDHYLYHSGTSKTLKDYFKWLADLVIEKSNNETAGKVLEIACNDGSQLDEFKKRGWKTFGVDPAANIAPIAQQKGHTIKVGFWDENIQLQDFPRGESLTAIVAQNVIAHVANPVGFLKTCAKMMGPSTNLYIQTSQCNMHQLGQFDTAYHEHISFFTGHSFVKASVLAGLQIVSFQTTPIHGTSCLVTMKLPTQSTGDDIGNTTSETMQRRIADEKKEGITTDFFYEKYAARSQVTRSWIIAQVNNLREKGYSVGAYGASAKGMTLLHFILDDDNFQENITLHDLQIDFVLDDAPLKQNTYCPGTTIPVYSTNYLNSNQRNKKLAMIIFAWNFWEEIAKRLSSQLVGILSEVLILLPFPTPKLLRLTIDNMNLDLLREVSYTPTKIPNIYHDLSRNKIGLVTYQRNEEMLIPFFILHHSPMFDHAFFIDFKSTDRTRELFEKYAPASWKIVESTTGEIFDIPMQNVQVMHWENVYPQDWAITLTITEFLVYDNFRQSLFERQPNNSYPYVHRFNHLVMFGNDTKPLRHFTSLIEQRHQFGVDYTKKYGYMGSFWNYGRFLHLNSARYEYGNGRHRYATELIPNTTTTEMDGFIVKWLWTPWPESFRRKTEVGATIPNNDTGGSYHKKWVSNETEKIYKEMSEFRQRFFSIRENLFDLCDDANTIDIDFNRFNRSVGSVLDPHGFFYDNLKNIDFIKIKRIFYSVTGIECGSNTK